MLLGRTRAFDPTPPTDCHASLARSTTVSHAVCFENHDFPVRLEVLGDRHFDRRNGTHLLAPARRAGIVVSRAQHTDAGVRLTIVATPQDERVVHCLGKLSARCPHALKQRSLRFVRGDVHVEGAAAATEPAHIQEREIVRPRLVQGVVNGSLHSSKSPMAGVEGLRGDDLGRQALQRGGHTFGAADAGKRKGRREPQVIPRCIFAIQDVNDGGPRSGRTVVLAR